MKYPLFSLLIFLFAFTGLQAQSVPLAKGQNAIDFSAPASLDGKEFEFTLRKALADGPVVLYFFPSAYTQGCDLQAHTFSEFSEDFKKAGATVIGISADDIKRLKAYSADPEYCGGNFAVASDPNGEIARLYRLEFQPGQAGFKDKKGRKIDHGFIERVTFVIDNQGKIAEVFSSRRDGVSPDEHVEKALKAVQEMKE